MTSIRRIDEKFENHNTSIPLSRKTVIVSIQCPINTILNSDRYTRVLCCPHHHRQTCGTHELVLMSPFAGVRSFELVN